MRSVCRPVYTSWYDGFAISLIAQPKTTLVKLSCTVSPCSCAVNAIHTSLSKSLNKGWGFFLSVLSRSRSEWVRASKALCACMNTSSASNLLKVSEPSNLGNDVHTFWRNSFPLMSYSHWGKVPHWQGKTLYNEKNVGLVD